MKNKLEKLNINLFSKDLKDKYNKERAEYIAENKDIEYKSNLWNIYFPKGFEDWNNRRFLTPKGQQNLINKINEIIDVLNK